jgi:hypothetical protein
MLVVAEAINSLKPPCCGMCDDDYMSTLHMVLSHGVADLQ